MSFDAENDLERALIKAPSDPSARPDFYRLLLDSNVFVIGKIEGRKTAEGRMEGERMMIATIEYEGRHYHPVFSALSRLKVFAPAADVEHLSMAGRALFGAAKGAHFLLNPGSDFGKELRAEELAEIMGATRVMIGQPQVYPQKLVDALKVFFIRTPAVKNAFLVQVAFENKDEAPHPLIGIEHEGDWQAISKEMGEVMKTADFDSMVDMIPIDRTQQSGVMKALLSAAPFYARA